MSFKKNLVFRLLQSLTSHRTKASRRFSRNRSQAIAAPSESLENRCLLSAIVPTLSFSDVSMTEGNAAEGNATSTTVVMAVRLDAATELPVSVNFATLDGTARAGFDFVSQSGTITIPAGELSGQISLQILADSTDEPSETFSITFSEPVNALLNTATALVTIQDDDLPPTVSIADLSIAEGNTGTTTASVEVSLSAASELPISINYVTRDGSAKTGAHYLSTSGTLTIPAGQTSAQLPISIMTDLRDELNKSFEVLLSSPVNATISRGTSVVTIADDDLPAVVTIADRSILEANSGNTSLILDVSLDHASELPVSFSFQTRDSSARAGSDYRAAGGTITIPAGQTAGRITLSITGDLIHEADETFDVVLSALTNATASSMTSTITILNNDVASAVRVADAKTVEGSEAEIRFSLNKVSSFPIIVHYATVNQTAVSPGDFTSTTGTVTIPAGAFSVVVRVPTIDDLADEPDEAFTLNITSLVHATIADGSARITITDNDPPVLAIADASVVESEAGVTRVSLSIRMTSRSPVPVTVGFQTQDLSAIGGLDFVMTSGTVVIPAGSQFGLCTIEISNDLLDELDEAFDVILQSPVGATLSKSIGRVTIIDNDAPPVISIENKTVTENGASNHQLAVTLSTVSGRPVTFDIRAQGITTQPSLDFLYLPETVTIPAGTLSVSVPFTIRDDEFDEPNEAFTLNLQSPSGAVLGKAVGIVTINDDDGIDLPLFELSDMAYLGAFQVPAGRIGSSTFEYGGSAITFNPANNSLFLASNINSGLNVAEIAIPSGLVSSGLVSEMQLATILQPFTNLSALLRVNAAGRTSRPSIGYENLNLGGLLVAENGLTGGMFMGYNGAEPQNSTHSHFRTNTLNLAALNATSFTGLIDIRRSPGSSSGRIRGGYMTAVPEQWRAWIGSDYVTGAAGQNRIQFSSSGPALFGFDAANPRGSSGNALVAYPHGQALQWSDTPSGPMPIFNGTTSVDGVAFVPGTRSVVFFGSNGLSSIGYGDGALFNDTARPYSGFHSQNGNYSYQIWAYDIDDFVSVRNGTKAAWEIRPTSVLNFDLPTPEPSRYLGGTAFDPATGRLYVSQKFAGRNSTPVIHVYQLGRTNSGTVPAAAASTPASQNTNVTTPAASNTASNPQASASVALAAGNTTTRNTATGNRSASVPLGSTTRSPISSTASRPASGLLPVSVSASRLPLNLTDSLFASLDLELDSLR